MLQGSADRLSPTSATPAPTSSEAPIKHPTVRPLSRPTSASSSKGGLPQVKTEGQRAFNVMADASSVLQTEGTDISSSFPGSPLPQRTGLSVIHAPAVIPSPSCLGVVVNMHRSLVSILLLSGIRQCLMQQLRFLPLQAKQVAR